MKKHNYKDLMLGFILGLIVISTIGVFAVNEILSKNIEYDNSSSGLEATNAQDALDEIYNACSSKVNIELGQTWEYDYTGEEQYLKIPVDGTYKLEVWGAQGGNAVYNGTYRGGYGAYAVGNITLTADTILYINVGGQGVSMPCSTGNVVGGYNGGGSTSMTCGSTGIYEGGGGGATHIATASGTLSSLSSKVSNVLIVGGAGGGGYKHSSTAGSYQGVGGDAGGIKGNNGQALATSNYYGLGGSQTSGGCAYTSNTQCGGFGYGGDAGTGIHSSAGGSGYYGGGGGAGYSSTANSSGGGGSSYIGNSNLTNKAMYCYSCTASSVESTKTISNTCVNSTATVQCSKSGNGYAKITYIG